MLRRQEQKMLEWFKSIVLYLFSFIFPEKSTVILNDLKLRIVKQIGEGGFSFVYLVQTDRTPTAEAAEAGQAIAEYLALKKILIQVEDHEQAFRREFGNYRKVGAHKNVLRLIDGGIVDGSNGVRAGYLLFPYYKSGTVQDKMDQLHISKLTKPFPELLKLAKGICAGVQAFHSVKPEPLAFRDLKPANVLIDDRGEAVLMDLGSVDVARRNIQDRKEAMALQEYCAETCSAPFRPAELFEISTGSVIDERTDIWSFGCLLYAMAFYDLPFDGTATSATSGKFTIPSSSAYPEQFHNLIRSLLKVSLNDRPSIYAVAKSLDQIALE